MLYDDHNSQALDILVDARRAQDNANRVTADMLEASRHKVDEARMLLAEMAAPAVTLVALRLAGADADWDGKPVTDERIEIALTILDRVGIPKLRATAIAASIAAAPTTPAPGSPGWEPPSVDKGGQADELDVGSVDAAIAAFLDGARLQRDIARDRPPGRDEAA